VALRHPAQKGPLGAKDEGERVRRVGDVTTNLAREIRRPAGDGIVPSQVTDLGLAGPRSLDGAPVDEPVDLARDVVIDLGEPERFEPARGSCAEVSERVPAVDDDGTAPV
jgi:hypothetical protein